MKKSRALLLIVALLMLIPTGVLTGCGGGESNAIQMMKWFPEAGEYRYINVTLLREPEFSSFYRGMCIALGDVATYGINIDDVSWIAIQEENDTVAMLLGGRFDSNKVRKQLDELSMRSSYRGVEIWTGLVGGGAVALKNGLLLGGNSENVYECIDVTKGLEQSLHDNGDLKDVAGRLPKIAFVSAAAISGESFPTDITDCLATAWGFEKIDAQTIRTTFVGKFKDAATASHSLSAFEKWATTTMTYNLEQVQSVQKGEFIKVTATFPISEFGTSDTTPTPTPTFGGTALDVDLHDIKTAVDTYAIQSGEWPTADGSLPPHGQYALLDFNASFDKDGNTMSFYPHFISELPRHWDEGVWRIDSAALVSVDMNPDNY